MIQEKADEGQPKATGRPGGFELTKQTSEALGAVLKTMSIHELSVELECSQDRARVISRPPKKDSKPVKVSQKVVVNISKLLMMDCSKVAKNLDGPMADRKSGHLPVAFEKLLAGPLLLAYEQGITPRFDLSELSAENALKIQPLLEGLKEYEKANPKPFRGKPNPWGKDMAGTELFLSAQIKITEILAGLTDLDLYGSRVVEFSVRETLDTYRVVLDADIDPTYGHTIYNYTTCKPAGVRCRSGFVIRSFPTAGESATTRIHLVYSGFNYAELKKEVIRKFIDWDCEELNNKNNPYFSYDGASIFKWERDYAVKCTEAFGREVGFDEPDGEGYIEWRDDDN